MLKKCFFIPMMVILVLTFLTDSIYSQNHPPVPCGYENLPVPKDINNSFRFIVIGDSQDEGGASSYFSNSRGVNGDVFDPIIDVIAKLRPKPEFLVFLGDMSLEEGLPNWKSWQNILQKKGFTRNKVYNVLGNHELGNPHDSEHGFNYFFKWQKEYQKYFSYLLPNNGPPGYDHLAYYFEHKNSLFVILDSYYIDPTTNKVWKAKVSDFQLSWLSEKTSHINVSHKFAFSHAPAFSITGGSPGDPNLWHILIENDFDVLFSGHEHLYARWVKGSKGYPVQIISGGAGGKISEDIKHRPPKNLGEVYSGHHFVIVDVDGRKVTTRAIRVKRENGPERVKCIDIHPFVKNPKD